jgi:NADPH:quinone reductase-like Zn-dependent oxidoreductase
MPPTVLTLGTGGVSIFALQLGKALGGKVIITSSSGEKLERARELGADHTINYKTTPDWSRGVLEATGGEGADVVVETGGAGTFDLSMKSARAGGTVAMLGALTGTRAEVTTGLILMRRLTIQGIYVDSRRRFEEMIRFIEQRAVRPVIGATFHFDQLGEGLRYMEAGRHFGKIVIET